jgi:acetylornithine deacetylase/succinyl-diaminopimelate desuccinylase-like protein
MVDEDIAEAAASAVDADEVLAFARALITAPSENPGGTEDAAAEVATGILTAIGASPETIRGEEQRPSVVASIGSGERPSLAWNGHLDVVPVGDLANWRHDPWEGVVRTAGRSAEAPPT